MKCKTCINYDVCSKHSANCDRGSDYCKMYKDRSKFVDLPCKVGDTVYVIDIVEYEIDEAGNNEYLIAPCTVSCIILLDDKIQIKCRETNNYIWTFKKDVFITQQEAETVLKKLNKEREKNG